MPSGTGAESHLSEWCWSFIMGELDPPNPRSQIARCSSRQRMINRCGGEAHLR
jgi:hypothetical protein